MTDSAQLDQCIIGSDGALEMVKIRNLVAYFYCNRKIKKKLSKETFPPDLISGHTLLCSMDSSLLFRAGYQFMFISLLFSA